MWGTRDQIQVEWMQGNHLITVHHCSLFRFLLHFKIGKLGVLIWSLDIACLGEMFNLHWNSMIILYSSRIKYCYYVNNWLCNLSAWCLYWLSVYLIHKILKKHGKTVNYNGRYFFYGEFVTLVGAVTFCLIYFKFCN